MNRVFGLATVVLLLMVAAAVTRPTEERIALAYVRHVGGLPPELEAVTAQIYHPAIQNCIVWSNIYDNDGHLIGAGFFNTIIFF